MNNEKMIISATPVEKVPEGMERVGTIVAKLHERQTGDVVMQQEVGTAFADPHFAEELVASARGQAKACTSTAFLATDKKFTQGYKAIFGKKPLPGEAEMN